MLLFLKNRLESDKAFILKILRKGEKQCDSLIQVARKYEKDTYNYFMRLFETQKDTALYFRIILKLEILLQKKFPEIRFLSPLKLNKIIEFHNELVKLSELTQNEKNIKKEIDRIVKNYNWLTIFHYTGKFLTAKDIIEKIQELVQKEQTIKKDSPIPHNKALNIYRYVIFLRTHLAESFAYSNAMAKPLLEKIAKNFGIQYDDILHMTGDELLISLRKKVCIVPKEEIASRKKRYSLFLYKKRVYILNKKQSDKVFGKPHLLERTGKILKGIPASSGKVSGNVCIIKNFQDFSKFKPNDILVAYSTTPNYIILMHMAKAFLTQEGGITSHAAIVSREMKKPCIVGIKNLISIVKDGDSVEIDANKGEVKIIKKRET